MPEPLDDAWLDALAGRLEPEARAALAARLAADPVAASAFHGWQRLADAVAESASARATSLPPLDGVLAAVRTPSRIDAGVTAHDDVARATLRALAERPIAPATELRAPRWVVAAAAAAAVLIVAAWPTPGGPLGERLAAALRPIGLEPVALPAAGPTPIARRVAGAARLQAAATSAAAVGRRSDGGSGPPSGAARAEARPIAAADGLGAAGRVPGRRSVGSRDALVARAAAGAPSNPSGVADGGAGYPPPADLQRAYPAPPSSPAVTSGDGRGPAKPSPSRTAPPPTAAATAAPTAPLPPTPAPTPTPAPMIVGVVRGPDGGGRAQVRVAAYRDDDLPLGASWSETFTADATGRYTLTLPAGIWRLYAEAPGHRPQWWPGADRPGGGSAVPLAAAPVQIDWQLDAAGDDDGLLVGRAGAHARVRAVPDGADAAVDDGPSALASGDGSFALPLPAGRWRVARSLAGRDRDWQPAAAAVTITAGTTSTAEWP